MDLERNTVAALIERSTDPRTALASAGWLEVGPEADGAWPLAEVAAMVADVAARSGAELAVGAHVAALATLRAAREEPAPDSSFGVLLDVSRHGEELRGRLWGPADADMVVVEQSGMVGVTAGAQLQVTPEPMLVLRQVAVSAATCHTDVVRLLDLSDGDASTHLARVAWLLAVEAFGAMADVVRRTTDYAGQRQLFGTTLAGMQVVQHRLVDMHIVSLLGAAIVDRSLQEWTSGAEPVSSWAAQQLAGTRAVWACEQAIQLHGGVGFTWELGLHRALALAQRARLLGRRSLDTSHPLIAAVRDSGYVGIRDWSLDFRSPAW